MYQGISCSFYNMQKKDSRRSVIVMNTPKKASVNEKFILITFLFN